jgi:uncharacterized membrane protein
MHANVLVLMLLALATACARPTAGEPPAAAAPAGNAAADTASAAQEPATTPSPSPSPSQWQSQSTPAQSTDAARTPAPGANTATEAQGIRVGEPDPGGKPWQRRTAQTAAWHAFGNEPFWSVESRGGTLVFKTPDDQAGVTLSGRRVPSLVGTVILGDGPKGEFHLGITPGECSDGMSDRTYAHASTFIYGGTTYKGCAEPR